MKKKACNQLIYCFNNWTIEHIFSLKQTFYHKKYIYQSDFGA